MIRILMALLFLALSALAHGEDWFSRQALTGNRMKVLTTGEDTHRTRLKIIENAGRSIYVSAFSFSIDSSNDEIFSALCRKAQDGLQVRVLADASGSKGLYKIEGRLLDCGINLMFFNPRHNKIVHDKARLSKWGFNHSLNIIHEKLLIVDGEHLVMGGSNFGNVYRNASRQNSKQHQYHDLNVHIQGPAACKYQDMYEANWKKSVEMDLGRAIRHREARRRKMARIYGPEKFLECDPLKVGPVSIIPVHANPMFTDTRPIMDRYKDAIAASNTSITLYAPYFQPTDEFIDLLLEARKRKVEVKILTNSMSSNDEEMSKFSMISLVKPLIAAKVKIYLWPKLSTLHRKGGVFDGKWAYFGSDNLSGRAQNYNSETVAFTDHPGIVQKMQNEMALDFEGAELLTEEKRAQIHSSFSKWLRKSFKILRPLM